jgi:hypothetical protein
MRATGDDQGWCSAWRISALSVTVGLTLALAACSGNRAPPAAGRLTGPQRGRTVAWQQSVSGVVTGLSAGDQAWVVIYPALAPGYWPQQGPLQLSQAGDFRVTAYFGASARQDSGEHFILRLVLAPPAASARIRAFQIQPTHQHGMLKLPAGVRTLAQVTVIRR